MSEEHPAMRAAHNSWDRVQRAAKDEWFELMAEDVVIEDPIGVSPLDPTGKGIRGKAGAREWWDRNIGQSEKIEIEAHESYAAGRESAHVMTITTTREGGVRFIVRGIFTYHLNDEDKIKALRGYWTMDQLKVEQPS